MAKVVPKLLFGLTALILLVGAVLHGRAFERALAVVDGSDLPAFYAGSLKALWLIDSATLLTLAIVFGVLAVRPAVASRLLILLLACIPLATASFQYVFLGAFIPAHALLLSAIAAAIGALALGGARAASEPTSNGARGA